MFVKFENISHSNMTFVQFHKKFRLPSFCGGWVKKLQTFTRYFKKFYCQIYYCFHAVVIKLI